MIVQHSLNRLLNLWNGMFNRHQVEITVMQFTGHSLPGDHSEVGPSPCPILSAELTCAISSHNCHWNVSLPSGASLWMAFLAGSKYNTHNFTALSTESDINRCWGKTWTTIDQVASKLWPCSTTVWMHH